MRLPSRLRPPDLLRTTHRSPVRCVAVPGLGLSVRGWEPTLARLDPGRDPRQAAAAIALPAYGVPAPRGSALDPRASAEQLIARLDELRIGRAVLLGHSASCQVVAEVARSAPGRVAALVLVGPTGDPAARPWSALVRRWTRTVRREPLWQVPYLLRDYTYSGMISFARAMDAARRHRLDDTVAALGCPILLVRGARDHICPPAWLDRLADRSGHAVIATVPEAAHMVPLTHPRGLAAALYPFVTAAGP